MPRNRKIAGLESNCFDVSKCRVCSRTIRRTGIRIEIGAFNGSTGEFGHEGRDRNCEYSVASGLERNRERRSRPGAQAPCLPRGVGALPAERRSRPGARFRSSPSTTKMVRRRDLFGESNPVHHAGVAGGSQGVSVSPPRQKRKKNILVGHSVLQEREHHKRAPCVSRRGSGAVAVPHSFKGQVRQFVRSHPGDDVAICSGGVPEEARRRYPLGVRVPPSQKMPWNSKIAGLESNCFDVSKWSCGRGASVDE